MFGPIAAALLACLAALALTMLAPPSASATPWICSSVPAFASGSSMQTLLQPGFLKNYWSLTCSNPPYYYAETPEIFYTPTSSGEGLQVFGMGNEDGEGGDQLLADEDPTVKGLEGRKEPCGPLDIGPPASCLDLFVGTDDPPTTAQLENATTASGGKSDEHEPADGLRHRGAVVVPVAQAPIVVMLSLPAGCQIAEHSELDLTNVALGQLWEGEKAPSGEDPGGIQSQGGYPADTWGALLTQLGYAKVGSEGEVEARHAEGEPAFAETAVHATLTRYRQGAEEEVETQSLEELEKGESKKVKIPNQEKVTLTGGGCGQEILPQVNSSESGTSYAFKGYLNQIDPTVWSPFWNDRATWPEEGAVARADTSTSGKEVVKNTTVAQLAENTAANPGSVGYADLEDARHLFLGEFYDTAGTKNFASPSGDTVQEVREEGVWNKAEEKVKIKVLQARPPESLPHQEVAAAVQTTGTATPTSSDEYAGPQENGGDYFANCQISRLVPADENYPRHWTLSWNGVLVSDPDMSSYAPDAYPLCALTYDVAWHHDRNVKLYGNSATVPTALAVGMGETAHSFFEFRFSSFPPYFRTIPVPMAGARDVARKNVGP